MRLAALSMLVAFAATAVAADPVLMTRDGNPFRLSALHGRKVLLVAWASY